MGIRQLKQEYQPNPYAEEPQKENTSNKNKEHKKQRTTLATNDGGKKTNTEESDPRITPPTNKTIKLDAARPINSIHNRRQKKVTRGRRDPYGTIQRNGYRMLRSNSRTIKPVVE